MPTAILLDDALVAALRARAASEGRSPEAVLADAVRRGLALAFVPASTSHSSEATPSLPSPREPEAVHATEADILEAEEQIPSVIGPAFKGAFHDALAAGSTLVIRDGDALVEVSPDGARRVLRHLPPLVPVHLRVPNDP